MRRTVALAALALTAACHGTPGPAAPGKPAFVVRGARVFDGERALDGVDVLVVGERIAAVGARLTVPAGATVIDGAGKTLLPGLVDSHFHTQGRGMLRLALAFGVTTVADLNSDELRLAHVRGLPAGATASEAELHGAGHLLTAPEGYALAFGGVAVPSPAACRELVAARLAAGADLIKIAVEDGAGMMRDKLPPLDAATAKACAEAAHAAGRKIFAHVTTVAAARVAVEAGVDGLAHGPFDAPMPDDLLALMARGKVSVTPTLVTVRSLAGKGVGGAAAADPAFAPALDPMTIANLKAAIPPFVGVAAAKVQTAVAEAAVPRYAAAGVVVLAGTDSPVWGTAAGVSLHQELELLVAAGLSPPAALAAATSAPAAVFGWPDRGRVAPGLLADLVLVDGDATRDITATRRIAAVWKHGARVDRGLVIRKVPLLGQGFAAYEAGRLPEAATAFAAALALDPGDGELAYSLAAVESKTGRVADALAHLATAVAYDPTFKAAAREDPDLAAVRASPAFAGIVEGKPR